MVYKVSPILFAVAKFIFLIADFAEEPEQSFLKGLSAFLEVITIYLIAKGVILRLRK
ncbi:MAG: hypothetical protein QXK24_02160 [Ignisphaera sp.]